jgi:hypothetical protein
MPAADAGYLDLKKRTYTFHSVTFPLADKFAAFLNYF